MSSDIRVAIIGAGYWGSNLIRTFLGAEKYLLHTVCDVRSALLHEVKKRHPQVSVTTSLEDVLSDTMIDSVVVATPPASHFSIAHQSLLAGKHVWVEKPLALRYADGQQLVTTAQRLGRSLFVDETFLYDPLVEQVRLRLLDGSVGKPHHISLERTGMGRIRRDSNVWWNSAPHDVSMLRFILNTRVRRIAATGHAFVQSGLEDVVWASLQLDNGVSAHIYLHWLVPEKKASLMLVGEQGMIRYEGRFKQRALTRYAYRLGSPVAAHETYGNVLPIEQCDIIEEIVGDATEPLAHACAAFRDTIVNETRAPSSGEQSLQTLAVLEAGADSLARDGAWVDVRHQG